MRERPGLGRARRGLGHGEEAAADRRLAHDLLPQALRLIRRQQERQPGAGLRIERVVVEPLDERRVRQDVRGFPDRATRRDLPLVEFRQQRLRQPAVGRDDRCLPGMTVREAGEQLISRERRQGVRHRAG